MGLCNYNRCWVDSFAEIAQPLNDLLKDDPDSKFPVQFTEQQKDAFVKLKMALSSVPALGIPDSGQPFTLFVAEKDGYMTSVLTQDHGDRQKPVGYYSKKLDDVALGWGPCLRAMQATYIAVSLVSPLVLDQQLIIKCPHAVHTLLTMNRAAQVTAARWRRLISAYRVVHPLFLPP